MSYESSQKTREFVDQKSTSPGSICRNTGTT